MGLQNKAAASSATLNQLCDVCGSKHFAAGEGLDIPP